MSNGLICSTKLGTLSIRYKLQWNVWMWNFLCVKGGIVIRQHKCVTNIMKYGQNVNDLFNGNVTLSQSLWQKGFELFRPHQLKFNFYKDFVSLFLLL